MVPRKRNQPQLAQEQIVAAAMKLIDERGLEGHSMRQLGAELGVDASTIYYYVPSKSDLYNLIVDEIMGSIDLSFDDPTTSFEERIVAAGREFRRALLAHPKAMPLMAARSLRTPVQLRGVEHLLGIFYDAGFDPAEAIAATDIFGMTVLGIVNSIAAHLTQSEYREQSDEFGELPPAQFPNLTRVFLEGRYAGINVEFDAAMRTLARGFAALHAEGTLVPGPDAPGTVPVGEATC